MCSSDLKVDPSLTPLTVEALGVEAPAAYLSAPEPLEAQALGIVCAKCKWSAWVIELCGVHGSSVSPMFDEPYV